MFKKQVILAIGVALALGTQVRAEDINLTELADYRRNTLTGGVGSPQSVDLTASGGATYVNTYTATSLTAGSHFVSLSAIPFGNTGLVTNGMGNQNPNGTGTLVQIIALEGVQNVSGTGVVTATFQHGVARLYQSNTTFVANNLATWGFPGTASAINLFAVDSKVLKGQEPVVLGHPNAYNSAASGLGAGVVNVVSTPVVANASVSGTALFRDSLTGPDIWGPRTTDGTPAGFVFLQNGSVIDFTDVFQASSNTNFDITGNSANLMIANSIFAAFGLEDAGLLANGGQFASAFNMPGVASAYSPNLTSAGTTTGDFASQLAVTNAPTIELTPFQPPSAPIPEPASMLAWGLIMAGAGAYGAIRRRNKKVA